jgi:transcriptional regulator with XRE-family HTH domain
MNKKQKVHTGKLIRKHRQLKGLTQLGLAEKIGKTQALISSFEKTGIINKYTLQEIAEALNMPVEQLNSEELIDEIQIIEKGLQKEKFYAHLLEEIDYLKSIIQNQFSVIQSLSKK